MEYSCPKCGYKGENLEVDVNISPYMAYMTCRNCNSSSGVDVIKTDETVTIQDSNTEPLEGSTVKEEDELIEEVKEDELSSSVLEKKINPSDTSVNEINDTTDKLVICPNCSSLDTNYIKTSAKTGYISCEACGYDSKAEGKKHRIGV